MVLEHFDIGPLGDCGQQRAFDFPSGHVLGVEDAALGMATFLAQVQLASAVGAGGLALGELHSDLDQLLDSRRALLHDCTDHFLPAQPRSRLERVAHVHLEGVLSARH